MSWNLTNCFYCISQNQSDDYSCAPHPSQPNVGICDKKGSSACIPISGTQGNYNLDTQGPVDNISSYLNSSNFFEVTQDMDGNPGSQFEYILDYPATCKEPIKPQLSYDEMRQSMGMRF